MKQIKIHLPTIGIIITKISQKRKRKKQILCAYLGGKSNGHKIIRRNHS